MGSETSGADMSHFGVNSPQGLSGQHRANAQQLHQYLTGETTCVVCSAVLAAGARRCPNPRCGACAECGAFGCRAGTVSCEHAIEQRFQRYRARVAPLAVVVATLAVKGRWA